MRIAVTGTPGVGKTSVSKELAALLKCAYIDLNRYAENAGFVTGTDAARDSKIVDTAKLSKVEFPEDCIIDGHLSHFCDADVVVVLRAKPDVLRRRLGVKGWSKKKVDENVEAEFVGVCSVEARELHAAVVDVDTTKLDAKKAARFIATLVKSKRFRSESIDWLEE